MIKNNTLYRASLHYCNILWSAYCFLFRDRDYNFGTLIYIYSMMKFASLIIQRIVTFISVSNIWKLSPSYTVSFSPDYLPSAKSLSEMAASATNSGSSRAYSAVGSGIKSKSFSSRGGSMSPPSASDMAGPRFFRGSIPILSLDKIKIA